MSESMQWTIVAIQAALFAVQIALGITGLVVGRRPGADGGPWLLSATLLGVPIALLAVVVSS